ncbi:MAG TPA: hypothetical protein VKE96_21970 [Vicinamibacterales bacterium]|nr:hypothetical protein [Vicinamibacterales bacterium]
MRVVKAFCCAAAITAFVTPAAHADEWNKKTILTFSGPVQVPGATLPAGSYVFKLADIPGNRHVVQVFNKDETKIYTTILAIPNERLEPTDKPVVLFAERARGTPQAVKVWYYPGVRTGDEFVYPRSQAMAIARATHERVLAYNDEHTVTNTAGEVPNSMKSARVGYFDETGNWQTEDRTVAVNSEKPQATTDRAAATTTSPPATARSNASASNTAAGTSGSRSSRRHLPRTAGDLTLLEILSGLTLAGGAVARSLRGRLATAR